MTQHPSSTGWTGVQYSAFRVGLAIAAAHVCWSRLPLVEGPPWPLLALGLPGALALALGWRDRAVAIVLLALVGGLAATIDGAPLVLPGSDVIFVSSLLFLHLFTPITPFGSWDAHGRVDPRGDWARPRWLDHAAWLWLCLIHVERALSNLGTGSPAPEALAWPALLFGAIQLTTIPALFLPRLRPGVWIALTLAQVAWITAPGALPGDGTLLLVHVFAASPAWWPGRSLFEDESGRPALLFYDGDCGFCHASARIVLAEDANTPAPLRLRFAPLAGTTFETNVANRDDVEPSEIPDSIVLLLGDGRLLTRSAAASEIASRLGGLWRGLALLASLLPAPPLDALYDGVARVRKRLFAKPDGACPILPPDLRARFDA